MENYFLFRVCFQYIICNGDLVFKKIPRLMGSISMRRSYHSRKRFFRKLFAPLQRWSKLC